MDEPNAAYGAHLMAYAGIPTFMRRPATRDLDGVDVAVVGIPFDSGAVSCRSGARFGPRKIRESSLLMWGYNRILQIAPLQVLKLVDYGDVAVEPADLRATMENIVTETRAVLASARAVIALGGDHSVTLPLLRAHAERFGPLAVVQFDAHSDTWPGDVNHGTSFRFAVQEGLIDRQAFVQVGIRGPLCGPEDVQAPEAFGARVVTLDECFEIGIPAVVRLIRERVGARPAYVSFDIDAVDPAYAPGVSTPEVGGFTSHQALQLVRGLLGLNLVGFDLVEVTPPYDPADVTSILAANLAFEFLSLVARHKSVPSA